MKIGEQAVVRLSVEMLDEGGTPQSAQEFEYLHGGYGMFPKVEAALAGLEPGGKASVTLAPGDGFGEHDPALVRVEPRERLPEDVTVGAALRGEAAEGEGPGPSFRVTALTDTEATLDEAPGRPEITFCTGSSMRTVARPLASWPVTTRRSLKVIRSPRKMGLSLDERAAADAK